MIQDAKNPIQFGEKLTREFADPTIFLNLQPSLYQPGTVPSRPLVPARVPARVVWFANQATRSNTGYATVQELSSTFTKPKGPLPYHCPTLSLQHQSRRYHATRTRTRTSTRIPTVQ